MSPTSAKSASSASAAAGLDIELIRRYDRPGPRYTSYPTAPNFVPLGAADAARELRQSNGDGAPLSLYVHLPFCRSVCYFCACNVIYTKDRTRTVEYVDLLLREAELVAALLDGERPVVQWHLGGGTPTFLPPEQLARLLDGLRARFAVAPDAERSVELDPRETNSDHVDVLMDAGFNRFSLGVQDYDPQVQQAVHRIQSQDQVAELVAALRARPQTHSVNFDLIYGLPYQSLTTIGQTLDAVLAQRPDRIALFNFAYVPWLVKHQRRIAVEAMPPPATKLEILDLATARLSEAGYRYVGMDHFALPGDELVRAQAAGELHRNFQGYTLRGDADMVGLGVTSIGEVNGNYLQNHKGLDDYRQRIGAGELATEKGIVLSDDDRLRRAVIRRLMCDFRLRPAAFEAEFGIDFAATFADELRELRQLEADGLVVLDADEIRVTDGGRFLVRNVAMVFDTYLPAEGAGKFSRTV